MLEKKEIDEVLLEQGIIKVDQFKKVLVLKHQTMRKTEDILLEEGYATKKDIAKARAEINEVDFVDLETFNLDPRVARIIPQSLAKNYKAIPIAVDNNILTVAMADPTDIFALDDLKIATSFEIHPVMALEEEIDKKIEMYFNSQQEETKMQENYYEEQQMENISEKFEFDELQGFDGNENFFQDESIKQNNNSDYAASFGGYHQQMFQKSRIGDILVSAGVISEEQLTEALKQQRHTGEQLGQILVRLNFVDKSTFYECLSRQLEIPFIDLVDIDIPEEIVKLVPENIQRRYKLIPVEKEDFTLKVAMSDPINIFSIDDLRLSTGLDIFPLLADVDEIEKLIERYFYREPELEIEPDNSFDYSQFEEYEDNNTGQQEIQQEFVQVQPEEQKQQNKQSEKKKKGQQQKPVDFEQELKELSEQIAVDFEQEDKKEEQSLYFDDIDNAPIVKLVNIILQRAAQSRASDIHIEPHEDMVIVRYRIDGQLMESMRQEKRIHSALVARIKIISGLNIAEKRIPQDGRITMKIGDKQFDLRVSILPTIFGEKVVIRIADKSGFNLSKKDLGFFEDDLEKFEHILAHPHGIILVTGPTGSGKSTTLYSALRELCKPNVNIITVEDPVESIIKGVNQVQVNVKAGLTFASALRSFLRQDPDIIMVGEIRDGETAEIAARAAITGHLVLSTLHTNDAASSVARLIDMGIEPFLLSSAIVGVIAQRLVRRLCLNCREEYIPTEAERRELHIEDQNGVIYKAKGCPECNNIGYKGRIAIYEIMTINDEIRDLIAKNVPSDLIKQAAIKNGLKTLRDNCVRMVKQGVTTLDELYRVAYSGE